jgi:hypothetical protein
MAAIYPSMTKEKNRALETNVDEHLKGSLEEVDKVRQSIMLM